jgi:DNA-binding protein H-NS
MNLKSMSIERLTTLRGKVDATLRSKVTETRRTLEAELAKLSRFRGSGGRGVALGRRVSPVAPKYQNPENPSETWAGRGLRPRWLAAALKTGHKIEEFLIGGASKPAAAKASKNKRGRKAAARKSSKPPKAAKRRKAKAARAPAPRRKAAAPNVAAQPEASA